MDELGTLTADEQALLGIYRQLSPADKSWSFELLRRMITKNIDGGLLNGSILNYGEIKCVGHIVNADFTHEKGKNVSPTT